MTTPFDLLNRLHSVAPHRITGTPEADAARAWLTQYLSEQGLEPELVDFHYRATGLFSRFSMLLNAWVTPLLGFFALALDPWIGLAALAALNPTGERALSHHVPSTPACALPTVRIPCDARVSVVRVLVHVAGRQADRRTTPVARFARPARPGPHPRIPCSTGWSVQ